MLWQKSNPEVWAALYASTSAWDSMVIMGNNLFLLNICIAGFPGGAVVKNPPANVGGARDAGSIPGSGRSPGVGNGNALQYSCLGNSIDRGAWCAIVRGVIESNRTEHVYTHTLSWVIILVSGVQHSNLTLLWVILHLKLLLKYWLYSLWKVKLAQSCLTFCDPMDCSLPCSSIRGILQARIPRDWTRVSCIAGRRFTTWATREAHIPCGVQYILVTYSFYPQ